MFKEAGARERTIEELGDEIASLAARMSAAMCRWLGLVAEFDERRGWGVMGCASCAHWVSWRCGVAPVTAREHVRVAQRLRSLPLVEAAFARGELSYSKVRALTRVEAITNEAELLELARHANAAQLERIVGAYRGVTREEADHAYTARRLDLFTDLDGSLVVTGRLPAEMGALLLAAVREAEAQPEHRDAGTRDEAGRPAAAARRADALVWLAETATAAEPGSSGGGRCEVVVHVDADTLVARDAEPGGQERAAGAVAELQDGPPLAGETIRRLCCDAGLVPVAVGTDGGVLDVGRRTRSIPPALRRALRVRDQGCRFPGCDRTRWLHAHHVEHWAHGGPTRLSNLVMLCHHHHQLVHEGGFTLDLADDGVAVEVRTPGGQRLDPVPPGSVAPAGEPGSRAALAAGEAPGPDSLFPLGAGAPWDLGLAVDAVLAWSGGLS